MYVCICNAVSDGEIRQAVRLGATSLKDLREGLGVATNCGKCVSCAKAVLREELSSQELCENSFEAEGGQQQRPLPSSSFGVGRR
jgi:bacterioferritin-associated ferredoxin